MRRTLLKLLVPMVSALSFIPIITDGQGVVIQPGTTLKFSGSPNMVIPAGNLVNNGTYSKANETIKFSGAGTHEIKGTQLTNMQNLTVASGTSVHLPPGIKVTVSGALENNAGNTGLIIESDVTGDASLIHSTTGVDGTVSRYIPLRADELHGWHFLSSPVAAQPIQTEFVPNPPSSGTQAFFSWDEPSALWINTKDVGGNWAGGFEANFIPGKGYLINYPASETKNFTGDLNVADVMISNLTKTAGIYSGSHLIGNPYSSPLVWNTGWTLNQVDAVAKIWNGAGASYSDINPGDVIPASQAFMVHVTTAPGAVTIPASARTHTPQAWYKSTSDPLIKLVAKDVANHTFQESVIRFNPEASVAFDPAFDSYFMEGYAPLFYSIEEGVKLSTNVLPDLSSQTSIPMGFIKSTGTNYSIEATKLENISQPVYLIDLKLNQDQNLLDNPVYAFTSSAGDDPSRFLLSFRPLGVESISGGEKKIYSDDHQLFIRNPGSSVVEVYNMIGQKLITTKTHDEPLYALTINAATGYYLVRLTTGQNVVSEKVFVK